MLSEGDTDEGSDVEGIDEDTVDGATGQPEKRKHDTQDDKQKAAIKSYIAGMIGAQHQLFI